MNDPYLFTALEAGPRTIARLVGEIADVDHALDVGRFTVREAVAHLADVEEIMRDRMRQAVARPGSTILAFDEGERAIRLNYAQAGVGESLDVFAARRAETVAYLRSLAEEDWERVAIHEERGPYSVGEQAHHMVCHDLYHVEPLLRHPRR